MASLLSGEYNTEILHINSIYILSVQMYFLKDII